MNDIYLLFALNDIDLALKWYLFSFLYLPENGIITEQKLSKEIYTYENMEFLQEKLLKLYLSKIVSYCSVQHCLNVSLISDLHAYVCIYMHAHIYSV